MAPGTQLTFILVMPGMSVRGDFSYKDLPGTGRRVDIVCRCLAACFGWGPSCWPRSQLRLVVSVAHQKTLTFRGPDIVPECEVEWAELIRDALRGESVGYVSVRDESVAGLVSRLQQRGDHVWVLDESGTPIDRVGALRTSAQNSFMLGDHRGFDSQTEEVIVEYDLPRVRLGPVSYLSSHCIAAVISYFERMVHT